MLKTASTIRQMTAMVATVGQWKPKTGEKESRRSAIFLRYVTTRISIAVAKTTLSEKCSRASNRTSFGSSGTPKHRKKASTKQSTSLTATNTAAIGRTTKKAARKESILVYWPQFSFISIRKGNAASERRNRVRRRLERRQTARIRHTGNAFEIRKIRPIS